MTSKKKKQKGFEDYVCRILIIMFVVFCLIGFGLDFIKNNNFFNDLLANQYAKRKMKELDTIIEKHLGDKK